MFRLVLCSVMPPTQLRQAKSLMLRSLYWNTNQLSVRAIQLSCTYTALPRKLRSRCDLVPYFIYYILLVLIVIYL